MAASPQALAVLTAEQLREVVREAVEPLRLELERIRSGDACVLVPYAETARRLGISLRSVQRRVKDGRIEVVEVGGERMCRLPAGLEPR